MVSDSKNCAFRFSLPHPLKLNVFQRLSVSLVTVLGGVMNTDEYILHLINSQPEIGIDIPNKKYYDPRAWLRKAEESFISRLTQAFEDLNNVNTLN